MATTVPSQQELYDLYKNEAQSRDSTLTDFEEGAINDCIAGGLSVAGEELSKLVVDKFNKTFFATSHGTEVTGDADDLEFLAKDHFGDLFARQGAQAAVGVVEFSRPNADAGNVTIGTDVIVKTNANAQGLEQRFQVTAAVTLIGTTISASVVALVPGTDGNVLPGTIVNIETALTDSSVVVANSTAASGGSATQTDPEYREFIRNGVERIRGATKTAIEAASKNVPGVEIATAIEDLQSVIEWDVSGSSTIGDFFFIPRVRLFVADANGAANAALVALVDAAVLLVRACGVKITVIGATPQVLNWTGSITLNPSGPNFTLFQTDTSNITATMGQYIRDLQIGEDFDRNLARAAILAIWGPSGTNDLTNFASLVPAGNIDVTAPTKLIPGTMATE